MKKIVLALLIAVVAFTFVGCPKVYGDLDIDWDSAEGGNEAFGVATIDTTKDEPSENQRRGMRFLATKHTDLACKVEIEDVTAAGSSTMGLAFAQESEKVKEETTDAKGNKVEVEKEYMDFALVGFNVQNGKVVYYVSVYKDVDADKLSDNNFGAVANATTGAREVVIKDFTTTAITPADNKVAVDITVDEDEQGNYIVTFANGDNSYTVDIPYTAFDNRDGKSGVQGYTGFYANCYANKSLKGKWTVTDIEGNPIPLEWADTEANPLIK